MNFGFSDEQDLLRDQVRKFLDEQCPIAEVRRIMGTPEGYSREHWKQLAELGLLGIAIPEAHGGAALGWVDLVVVLEETGRSLFPSPFISTTLFAQAVLDAGDEAQQARWLPGIAQGQSVATVAATDAADRPGTAGVTLRGAAEGEGFRLSGETRFVPDAAQADRLLVAFRSGEGREGVSWAVLERDDPGVSIEAVPTLDETKRVANLRLEGVRLDADRLLGAPGAAWAAIERHLDRGATAITAEMIGAGEGALALTVQFAKDRVQFGSPIGRYQGVKHPLAECYVDLECLKSLCYYAAWALDDSPADVSRAVSEAKAFGSEALTRLGVVGIQLHGAVGYTQEYDIQLYLKRSKWVRPAFGDEEHHFERLATLGGY